MEIPLRPGPFGRTDRGHLKRGLLAASIAALAFVAGCNEFAASTAQPAEPAIYAAGERLVLNNARLTDLDGRERQVQTLLNVRTPMKYGDYVWNDEGVPEGDIWMVVDLRAQTISVFRGEHEIGTAVTLYGADKKPTPVGRYVILEKRRDHWSNLYDAPMPFTLRLTNDGISIHGAAVQEGFATHGCLGIPIDFASRLFAVAKRGNEVLVLKDIRSHVATRVAAS